MPARSSRGAEQRSARRSQHSEFDGQKPVRRVVSRRTKKVVGLFPSAKSDFMVPWESQLERDFLYLLEIDHGVSSYCAQPERLHLVVEGQPRQHVPDLFVQGKGAACWLVEVKTDDAAALPPNRAVFAAAAEACLQRNIGYQVVVQSWIRREPRLSNAKLMLRYRSLIPNIDQRIRVVSMLQGASLSLAELRQAIGGDQAFRDIMAFLLDGTVSTDLDQPICDASHFWLTGEGGAE